MNPLQKVLGTYLHLVFEIFFGDFGKEKLNGSNTELRTSVFILRTY